MTVKHINIATEFSEYPGMFVVYKGLWSAEHLREDILRPALKDNDEVIIDIKDVRGFASTFLKDCFTPLAEFEKRIKINCYMNQLTYVEEIGKHLNANQLDVRVTYDIDNCDHSYKLVNKFNVLCEEDKIKFLKIMDLLVGE